jgi:hypothetical protein
MATRTVRFAGSRVAHPWPDPLCSSSSCDEVVKGSVGVPGKKVSCEDCYFKRNGLCALSCDGPCPTFRPDHPDGLRPPQQMHFVFRQERRRQVAWAMPSAQEQAALHA